MSNHFCHLLSSWLPLKDEANWVLGAVINTRGSVYRKTGALMLLSDAGHQLGLLSGGCIESDLLLQARKVVALGKSRRVVYDASGTVIDLGRAPPKWAAQSSIISPAPMKRIAR